MMFHLVVLFSSGLLLLPCEKPDASYARRDEVVSSNPRTSHPVTELTAEQPITLNKRLDSALAIESPAAYEKALAEVAWSAMETEVAHEAFHYLPADSPEKIRMIQHYAMLLAEMEPEKAL